MCSLESFTSRAWVLNVVVLCYIRLPLWHYHTWIYSDVFSGEGDVDLKLVIPIELRIILLQNRHDLIALTLMIVVEWKLTTFVHQERGWMRHHAFVGSPGSVLRAEWRATPLVCGGVSNHGSWRKNMVNSYIPTWISNYIHYDACDEITYPFPSFNGATVSG